MLNVAHQYQQATDWHLRMPAGNRMKWEVVIGLETHAQLSTQSKIFSGASTAFGASPNTQASAVDIALPGVLPVLNRGAVRTRDPLRARGQRQDQPPLDIRAQELFLSRPAQGLSDQPVRAAGRRRRRARHRGRRAAEKTVRLTRAHLEEDAGKSLHEDFHGMSGIDLNRAGTPLLEIVTEPDMRRARGGGRLRQNAARAGALDRHLRRQHAGRLVPLRRQRLGAPGGSRQLGTRCEIKNLNSFRFMEQAIKFEVRRQIDIDRGRRQDRAGDAALRSRHRTKRARCARRKTRRTIAIFRIRICCRWKSPQQWIEQVQSGTCRNCRGTSANAISTNYGLSAYDAASADRIARMGGLFRDGACVNGR